MIKSGYSKADIETMEIGEYKAVTMMTLDDMKKGKNNPLGGI